MKWFKMQLMKWTESTVTEWTAAGGQTNKKIRQNASKYTMKHRTHTTWSHTQLFIGKFLQVFLLAAKYFRFGRIKIQYTTLHARTYIICYWRSYWQLILLFLFWFSHFFFASASSPWMFGFLLHYTESLFHRNPILYAKIFMFFFRYFIGNMCNVHLECLFRYG